MNLYPKKSSFLTVILSLYKPLGALIISKAKFAEQKIVSNTILCWPKCARKFQLQENFQFNLLISPPF